MKEVTRDDCAACGLFDAYDGEDRNPNNCSKWLCNSGACPVEGKPARRYDLELLPVCQSIHSSVCGSSDPLAPEVMHRYVEFLRMRLATWQQGPYSSRIFDEAVRSLCEAAVYEADREGVE